MTAQELAQTVWNTKEWIRNLYDDNEVEDVILPFTLLRRLDCVLDEHREDIMEELRGIADEDRKRLVLKSLLKRYNLSFFNLSGLSLKKLLEKPNEIGDNFKLYLEGFTDNIKGILGNFLKEDVDSGDVDLSKIYERLLRGNKLFEITSLYADLKLHPNETDNAMMGTAFEIVIRYAKESTNSKAGQYYTPREIVRLLVSLTLCGNEEEMYQPGKIFSIYDPCCGTGGMLTVAKDYLQTMSNNPKLKVNLYGQELYPKTYAICKSDLLMKDELQSDEQIALGNTLTDDYMYGKRFKYMLANPPFGVKWGDKDSDTTSKLIEREHCPGGRFEAGLPDKSDGSLLFLQHMISKMDGVNGSRIGIVLNGSPLFNGDAGSGWSDIRKMLLDRNLLDAIVALPKNMFYGTDIVTYLWILDNKRGEERRNKVLFINANHGEYVRLLQRSLGKKRYEVTEDGAQEILDIYKRYEPYSREIVDEDTGEVRSVEVAKLLDYDEFLYRKIAVVRPLRLWFENVGKIIEKKCERGEIDLTSKKHAIVKELMGVEGLDERRSDGEFFGYLKKRGFALKAGDIKLIRSLFGTTSEDAPVVHDNPLKESSKVVIDTALNDTENVPFTENVEEYFEREVLPFAPDAEIDESKEKVGCEFPFTKLFYEYKPLRSVEEIVADLRALEGGEGDDLTEFINSL